MKKLVSMASVTNAAELKSILGEFVDDARMLSQAEVRPTGEEVYVTINSDSVRVCLMEETLADGSKVYNIELAEVTGTTAARREGRL